MTTAVPAGRQVPARLAPGRVRRPSRTARSSSSSPASCPACSWPRSTRRSSRRRSAPSPTTSTACRSRRGRRRPTSSPRPSSTPLYGKLSDLYGRRPFFIAAISIFVLGSALSGARPVDVPARRVPRLPGHRRRRPVLARARRSSPTSCRRGSGPGTRATSWPCSAPPACSGPVIGGFLAGQQHHPGHHRLALGLPRQRADRHRLADPRRPDAAHARTPAASTGSTTRAPSALVVALVPILIVAEQGREWGWSSGRALTCYVIGVVGIVALRPGGAPDGDDALLPLRLFRGRTFSVGSMLNFVVGMGMFGAPGRPAALHADRQGLHARPRPACCCCRWSSAS